jgi:hypothetical protein
MPEIVLRFRPLEVVTDLDPAILHARAAKLTGWQTRVVDSRLTDATFLTVVASIDKVDEPAEQRLKDAFSELPGMQAYVWQAPTHEIPLADARLVRD